jgi:hypothetical protein
MERLKARIYRPAKTAMQSGRGNTRKWTIQFEAAAAKSHDPLMGWISSADTQGQVRLRFDTREEAVAFARKHNMDYALREPVERVLRPKSYADNFRWNRVS